MIMETTAVHHRTDAERHFGDLHDGRDKCRRRDRRLVPSRCHSSIRFLRFGEARTAARPSCRLATIMTLPEVLFGYTSFMSPCQRSSEPPSATFHSKEKMRRQSFFISTTVQPFALASSSALSSCPMDGVRS
jgi:hypothetical protein